MRSPEVVRRRRIWPILVPVVLVVALAILWTGLWFYAAAAADSTLAGWLDRETRIGHKIDCANRSMGGFPLRIELRCAELNAELRDVAPPVTLKSASLIAVWQVYAPAQVVGEFIGPMTIAEAGQPPAYRANWQHSQASVQGTPHGPERVSIVLDEPAVEQLIASAESTVLKAARVEADAHLVGGSANDKPVIDLMLRLRSGTAPELHPLAATPVDGEIAARLTGLADLAPKPWPILFRDLQANGGALQFTNARVQQGEMIAVANGTLGLTARGGLDGQLQLTVVNLDQLLHALNLDELLSQGRVGSAINALDRLMPGLGSIARQNAAPSVMASLGAIGQRTVLEDKPAMRVPLRFADGAVMLGPLPVGRVPPLF
jgi:hypothetical protein